MKRYLTDGGIPALEVALSECMDADDLKKLAALTKQKLPTRKADFAAVIVRHLDGERLRAVWQGLDELQRAAVAEVVHSRSAQFLADRFRAKYGRDPNWGSTDKYLAAAKRRHKALPRAEGRAQSQGSNAHASGSQRLESALASGEPARGHDPPCAGGAVPAPHRAAPASPRVTPAPRRYRIATTFRSPWNAPASIRTM